MEKQLENKDYCKKYRHKNPVKRIARRMLTESPRRKSTTRSTAIETLSTSQENGNGQRKKDARSC